MQCCTPFIVVVLILLLQFWLWGEKLYSLSHYYNILVVAAAASLLTTLALISCLHLRKRAIQSESFFVASASPVVKAVPRPTLGAYQPAPF